MHILFAALAVAFIGSFAATYGIALILYVLFPKESINPIHVSASFSAKEWAKILRTSLIAYCFMFTAAFIFFCFSKSSIGQNIYSSLAISAVCLIGLWNFAYFIFLIGKTTKEDATI